jgi:2-methylcitrate dehydratase PrpD
LPVRALQAEHGFAGGEVERVTVSRTRRMLERHDIREPTDLMLAQYSIPFALALALSREARDPESWDETALADAQIRVLTRRVALVPEPAGGGHAAIGSTVAVTLADGRRFERHEENGMLEDGELADKFRRLTRGALGAAGSDALYARLQRLEDEANLDWLTGLAK